MKLCPKCSQSFADGFTFCPKDAERLQKYDLRARVHKEEEFNFLLETEPLLRRLKRELVSAYRELKVNPRGFLRGLLRGEGSTRNRKRLLSAGIFSGLIVYSSVFMVVTLIGILHFSTSETKVDALPDPEPLNDFTLLLPNVSTKNESANLAKSGSGKRGGSLTLPSDSAGGGGGGDKMRTSRGVPPPPSLDTQLAQPDPTPPVIEQSTLIIRPTIYADPNSLPKMNGPIGMPDSPPEAPLSRGSGPGAGNGQGKGPGYGPGSNGGWRGGKLRIGGPGTGSGGDGIPTMSDKYKPTILYREKARYTEEARQNRVQGTVMLTIVFGADGRIRDIRTIHGLPNGLTESAIEAAQKIRFQPAVDNGRPISVRATLEFNFALY